MFGGSGGIRTHGPAIHRLTRFRVGAVMTTSIRFRIGFPKEITSFYHVSSQMSSGDFGEDIKERHGQKMLLYFSRNFVVSRACKAACTVMKDDFESSYLKGSQPNQRQLVKNQVKITIHSVGETFRRDITRNAIPNHSKIQSYQGFARLGLKIWKTISSAARYDHFDMLPYLVLTLQKFV